MKLTFAKKEVTPALAHCLTGKARTLYGAETGPGLWLVGDNGIYLMSNSSSESAPVVYATECNPTAMPFDEWWEAKRRFFGGDDGVEFIAAADIEKVLAECTSCLVIDITPKSFSVMPDRPPSKRKKH